MILESVKHGPLLWPSIEENGVTRPKKYPELSATEEIQANCDVKATNIIFQGLLTKYGSPYQSQQYLHNKSLTPFSITYPSNDFQSSVHHNVYSPSSSISQVEHALSINQQPEFSQPNSGLIVLVFQKEGKATCPKSALNQRGNEMIHGLRIKCCCTAKVELMVNLSHYGLDALVEYVIESQQAAVQNSNFAAQQDPLILYNKDNVLDSCARSVEIDHLKQTLLKNDFKKEKSRNVDKEIALEHRIKHLDNIVFKRGFQNPFYLKKAEQLEPKLYDGNVIEKTNAIMIYDTEETLMLAEESHSKMLLKQKDPMILEKKVNTTPVDYNSMNSLEPTPSSRPTKVEVPKELPKVCMSQEKDMVIKKLKERIKSLSGNLKENYIKKKLEEIETINTELEHRVPKLIAENEHLKQTNKKLYDLIKSLRIQSKEQCDDLINQVNLKSLENSDLNASLQEKVLVITALKDNLRKLKGRVVVDDSVTSHPIDPEMLKVDVAPLAPKLQNNRKAHSDYIRHTPEQTATLREIVKQGKSLNPLNNSLDYACKYTKRIQELLTLIR
nr:hypothetical protein [Tanacetum cinerariifolium]